MLQGLALTALLCEQLAMFPAYRDSPACSHAPSVAYVSTAVHPGSAVDLHRPRLAHLAATPRFPHVQALHTGVINQVSHFPKNIPSLHLDIPCTLTRTDNATLSQIPDVMQSLCPMHLLMTEATH
jgi:hypothetical protein